MSGGGKGGGPSIGWLLFWATVAVIGGYGIVKMLSVGFGR